MLCPLTIYSLTDEEIDDDDDDEEEFRYPMSPSDSIRPSSRSSSSTGYFSRPESHRTLTDLTPQLSQSPDFRVPTHEAPQKVARWTAPSPHQIHRWEKDEDVSQCRECERRFNFITRRVSAFTIVSLSTLLTLCVACRSFAPLIHLLSFIIF